GVRPVLLADLQKPVADLIDRLLPADAVPAAAFALQRVLQPAMADRQLTRGRALGAVGSHVDGALEDRLLAQPDAVLHLRPDAATDGAEGTDRLLALDFARLLDRPLARRCRLADPGEGACRRGRQAGDAEAAALQEQAARKRGRGGGHEAARVADRTGCGGCSTGQHGCGLL